MRKALPTIFSLLILTLAGMSLEAQESPYSIVHTGLSAYFDATSLIEEPSVDNYLHGQDAGRQYNMPSYTNHENGCVTDIITGLMWQQDMGEKLSWTEAVMKADTLSLGGYEDWRIPTIRELYSLILFNGRVFGASAMDLFIDTAFFIQPLGDTDAGEREIDAQTWSSTHYRGLTMTGDTTIFGVNFVDGRIKGYPKFSPKDGTANKMYFRMVRGNLQYGQNEFEENGNGTISDHATGLMWQQDDDGVARDWEAALEYCETLNLAGLDDWHLPHVKELQSILDYSRGPQSTGSGAINPLFGITDITDPDGNSGQYPYFWSSTTHQDGPNPYNAAAYFAFGEAQGMMNDQLMDVHGAGAQRSDPKAGNAADYPQFLGPQGDVRYVYNYCRCVRRAGSQAIIEKPVPAELQVWPNPTGDLVNVLLPEEYSKGSRLSLQDMAGKVWITIEDPESGNHELNLEQIPGGIYLLVLEQPQETPQSARIVKAG